MAGTRKIAAILVGDIVGYSRLAGADEDRTLSRLRGPFTKGTTNGHVPTLTRLSVVEA
jgi:hypothetical protein